MGKSTGPYPLLSVDTAGNGFVSQAGAVTLLRTAEKTGPSRALSAALSPWRKPLASHDPGKIVLDLAVAVALDGDCLADIAVLREQPAVFGHVASDPRVSRLITTLAADAANVLSVIDRARAAARKYAWGHAEKQAPDHDIDAARPLIIDLDATLVSALGEGACSFPAPGTPQRDVVLTGVKATPSGWPAASHDPAPVVAPRHGPGQQERSKPQSSGLYGFRGLPT